MTRGRPPPASKGWAEDAPKRDTDTVRIHHAVNLFLRLRWATRAWSTAPGAGALPNPTAYRLQIDPWLSPAGFRRTVAVEPGVVIEESLYRSG
jgi:hypothetical protein